MKLDEYTKVCENLRCANGVVRDTGVRRVRLASTIDLRDVLLELEILLGIDQARELCLRLGALVYAELKREAHSAARTEV